MKIPEELLLNVGFIALVVALCAANYFVGYIAGKSIVKNTLTSLRLAPRTTQEKS
jgi:hypothetical protein